MESLRGNFTQVDFDKLNAELSYLEMIVYLGEGNEKNKKRIEEIKEVLKENL
ncbi:hypothetical protein KQH90_07085 [Anaerosalibacter bizertensis]|uniref:hypothetical protein n=1 Tax=Anaerosalibacter bizertensis TaxID=932217 RepID=UPI001766EDE3|nr:hypothetical protein [Anaerosalibacter bizertensis]MBU5293796.1 hypothetical protein [Anaerosalibacter bizertensis]HHV26925.1 hypothetical protein [Tissierellia bacterium]